MLKINAYNLLIIYGCELLIFMHFLLYHLFYYLQSLILLENFIYSHSIHFIFFSSFVVYFDLYL
jgi:hypothetical protein